MPLDDYNKGLYSLDYNPTNPDWRTGDQERLNIAAKNIPPQILIPGVIGFFGFLGSAVNFPNETTIVIVGTALSVATSFSDPIRLSQRKRLVTAVVGSTVTVAGAISSHYCREGSVPEFILNNSKTGGAAAFVAGAFLYGKSAVSYVKDFWKSAKAIFTATNSSMTPQDILRRSLPTNKAKVDNTNSPDNGPS